MSETANDALAREQGFDNMADLSTAISGIDLSRPGALRAFEDWKEEDGTKAGLVRRGLLPKPEVTP